MPSMRPSGLRQVTLRDAARRRGDALAFNRGAERAHHEDRVGVNTMIQKIMTRGTSGAAANHLCTTGFTALDPVSSAAALVESLATVAEERRERSR